jgi:trehalose 6-phosphate phosphatase
MCQLLDQKPAREREMQHILAKRHLPALADLVASNVLVAFDFDGTLAPIVRDPAAARMRRSTRRLLGRVACRYPCVVISGRMRLDLAKRIRSLSIVHLAGNHGLEPWGQHEAYRALVREWIQRLEPRLAGISGVVVEDKTYSLTVHYRNARRPSQALTAVRRALRTLRGGRSLGGDCAVSLVPRGAPTKGAALERARQLFACDSAIYVGDDQTDEEVFRVKAVSRLLGIRVGMRARSGARYGLRNQGEIDALLRTLLALRSRRDE